MAASFQVQVLAPHGVLFSGELAFLRLPGTKGEIGVYPNHSATLSTLKAGAVDLEFTDGRTEQYEVTEGLVHITETAVRILVPSFEKAST